MICISYHQWRSQEGPPAKKNENEREKEKKEKERKGKKLYIFMQQMQYNAKNRMYVFQNFSGYDTPSTAPPHALQNPGCAPASKQC